MPSSSHSEEDGSADSSRMASALFNSIYCANLPTSLPFSFMVTTAKCWLELKSHKRIFRLEIAIVRQVQP